MDQFSDKEKKRLIAELLREGHMYYINEVVRRPASQAEFSTWISISPNTFTRLINEQSLPNLNNTISIADRLGAKIFDILGIPRLMPSNPEFRRLMEYWDSSNDQQRRKFIANLKSILESIPEAKQEDKQEAKQERLPNGELTTG